MVTGKVSILEQLLSIRPTVPDAALQVAVADLLGFAEIVISTREGAAAFERFVRGRGSVDIAAKMAHGATETGAGRESDADSLLPTSPTRVAHHSASGVLGQHATPAHQKDLTLW